MFYEATDGKRFSNKDKADAYEFLMLKPKQTNTVKKRIEIATDPTHRKYLDYKKRINQKNKAFDLTLEEFKYLLEGSCTYCGIEDSNGVDRIDSNIGYTLSNSTSCCAKCNMMKYTLNVKDFIKHISKIYHHLS